MAGFIPATTAANMTFNKYIKQLNDEYQRGQATEHSYRGCLKTLLEESLSGVKATNEPKQVACGSPDYLVARNEIPLGYIEAKDLGDNLDDPGHREQLNRYRESLDNLIFTNYLEFRWLREGELKNTVVVGEIRNGKIAAEKGRFDHLEDLFNSFAGYEGRTITTADDLAECMAKKARLLKDIIVRALGLDAGRQGGAVHYKTASLQGMLDSFKENLLDHITPEQFSDIYAQTVAYGMFAARLHDDASPSAFSRDKALKLIPKTNPFLRKFFQHAAGYDLDERIRPVMENLVDVFRAADVGELMKDYGKSTQRNDPFIHFYETFLREYDPKTSKGRGVYYTPEPIVSFIVRAVDKILQTEFKLPEGLANAAKTSEGVHKVQILDPATGTGTFLAHVIKYMHEKYFSRQAGAWPAYVKEHLIPRLNGFELLMAPYTMAHIKLGMVLRESGCELDERLNIFLTNALGEGDDDPRKEGFATWLAAEANEANRIKRETPVMVVLGNPPYSVKSSNKGEWIQKMVSDYKKDLRAQSHNLNDDYMKFIRYGEYVIDKNGEGILAYVSNNGFLTRKTHRQMRKHLLQTFDKIYILDLHGNSNIAETTPDGSPDKNVFDIQVGVSINIFIKTGNKRKDELGRVFHLDQYGEREAKYGFLWGNDFTPALYKEIDLNEPYYLFADRDFSGQEEYEKGFSLTDLFLEYNSGAKTHRDKFTVAFSRDEMDQVRKDMLECGAEEIRHKYHLPVDSGTWSIGAAKEDIAENDPLQCVMLYRPFDLRHTLYTGEIGGFFGRPRHNTMRQMLAGKNFALILSQSSGDWRHVFVANGIYDSSLISTQTSEACCGFHLYHYSETTQMTLSGEKARVPNFDQDVCQEIADGLKLRFTPEKGNAAGAFAPIDVLDYIYAVLHSPSYREKYNEFLKIEFPHVPYPADKKQFRSLVNLGGKLRELHLLESASLSNPTTTYPETGDNTVEKISYEITNPKTGTGKVMINGKQFFGRVPESGWNFRLGGYLPAQKWLNYRKGRVLTSDEITHYRKVIHALVETGKIMQEIDKVMAAGQGHGQAPA